MALKGLDIFKLTPKTNCKECGSPTCMAFSMKVAQGAVDISKCPHMSAEALATLSEATAPPMKSIKVGTGDAEYTLGGETVLARHEKTFVSKTRFAVKLSPDMDIDAALAESNKVDYERIGERMHVELVYVNCDENADAAKFTALVEEGKKIFKAKSIYPLFVEVCGEDVFLFNLNSEKEGIVVKVNPQKMEKAYISKVFR